MTLSVSHLFSKCSADQARKLPTCGFQGHVLKRYGNKLALNNYRGEEEWWRDATVTL
jgi:hypothetical protein